MTEDDRLAERFERNRTRLRAVAYRILGSLSSHVFVIALTHGRVG